MKYKYSVDCSCDECEKIYNKQYQDFLNSIKHLSEFDKLYALAHIPLHLLYLPKRNLHHKL